MTLNKRWMCAHSLFSESYQERDCCDSLLCKFSAIHDIYLKISMPHQEVDFR